MAIFQQNWQKSLGYISGYAGEEDFHELLCLLVRSSFKSLFVSS
jgi:hypothetical protein